HLFSLCSRRLGPTPHTRSSPLAHTPSGDESCGGIEAISARGHREVTCRPAPLGRTVKIKASECPRPLKQWCFGPVCKYGHGGCDDSSGDTRRGRGLPFGSMP